MSERWLSDSESNSAGPSAADQETIALLEEEIARLEDELRLRDLAATAESQGLSAYHTQPAHDEEAEERIALLGKELASREETIALLLEQTRLADEAEAAGRAEWEQLHNWIQEVERRVAEQSDPGTELREQLADERRTNEILRQTAEKELRSWEVQRLSLVAEVERLRSRFTEVAGESDTSLAALRALEFENRELRDAYDSLARSSVPEHEMDAIVAELQSVRQQHAAAIQDLKQLHDDRQREHNEHEAALNALRSQLARDSLRRQEEQIKSTVAVTSSKESLLEADMRIRAFREHLKEIHHDETEQRLRRSLAARLSRLWNHTSAKS
jgi:hypothetical protein